MKLRFASFVACLGLAACTTGGISLPPGAVCPSNFSAPGTAANAKQIATDPADTSLAALPAGTYSYAYSDIYFSDPTLVTGGGPFEIQLHDGMTSAGTNATVIACAANVPYEGMKAYSFNLTAVTDMGVDAAGHVVAYTRAFSFSTDPHAVTEPGPKFTASVASTTGAASINTAIAYPPTVKKVTPALVLNPGSSTDYQLTLTYVDSVQGTYTMIIHMNYSPTIPTNVVANQKKP